MRRLAWIGLAAALAAAGCVSPPSRPLHAPRPAPPPSAPLTLPLTPPLPPDQVPDAVPRIEPRSAYGNPPFYDVFGVRYYVLPSFVGFRERGVASWYGPGFHEERTSTGEPYDMFGMTAAHKTLPLPAYVRVTNLQNGRSVVVRVNDRGPFVNNRIIDLSYTAAAKLDMLRNGTAMVEVAAIDPAALPSTPTAALPPASTAALPPASTIAGPPASTIAGPTASTLAGPPASRIAGPPVSTAAGPTASTAAGPTASTAAGPTASTAAPQAAATSAPTTAPAAATAAASLPAAEQSAPAAAGPPPAHAPLYIQAGAFANPSNAERLAAKLRGGGYGSIFVRMNQVAGRTLYRVRIGPVPDVAEFDRIVAALAQAGVADAHLALD